MKKIRVLCLVLGLTLLAPLAVFGGSFDTVVVFGDSLSDIGNIYVATKGESPPSEPVLVAPDTYVYYYQGRVSNGPVWAEYLTGEGRMNCSLVNMAYAGAKTSADSPPGMVQQVGIYLQTFPDLHEKALYVIWIGPNDFLDNPTPDYQASVANIVYGMEMLASKGIENLLVLNMPNLGATPRVAQSGIAAQDAAKQLSIAFNAELATAVAAFKTKYPAITVYEIVDIFAILEEIIADPASYGFTNASIPLVFLKDHADPDFDNTDGYVFWDDIHPTTETHEVVADEALAVLPADAVADDDDDDDSDGGLCFIQTVFSVR